MPLSSVIRAPNHNSSEPSSSSGRESSTKSPRRRNRSNENNESVTGGAANPFDASVSIIESSVDRINGGSSSSSSPLSPMNGGVHQDDPFGSPGGIRAARFEDLFISEGSIENNENVSTRALAIDFDEPPRGASSQEDSQSVGTDRSASSEDVAARLRREQEESEALARQLMEEEAMESYALGAQFLRDNAAQFSTEDLAALQAVMAEDARAAEEAEGDDLEGVDSAELSYETLLRLGDRLGDVKQERWALKAQGHIDKLPCITFAMSMAKGKDENDSSVKCLVCQHAYVEGDSLRLLPCKHVFHTECVDEWLLAKDNCPYCRQCIHQE